MRDPRLNHRPEVVSGVLDAESGELLRAPTVVVNADPKRALRMLAGADVPDPFRERLEGWQVRSPVVKLNAALHRLPSFTAAGPVAPERAMVSITGSVRAGKEVAGSAASDVKRVHLELGGKAPVMVFDDADLAGAAEGIATAAFFNAGQDCTAATRVLVAESVHDEFMERFTKAVEESPIGDPTQDVLYGPMIHERFAERFEDWLGLIRDHHIVSGSSASGRISADNPRDGFVGDPAYDRGVAARDWTGELLASTHPGSLLLGYCRVLGGDPAITWEWAFVERVCTGLYVQSLGGDGSPHLTSAALLLEDTSRHC